MVAHLAVGQAATQSSIQIFGPVDVRLSAVSTGTGASADNFNSSTLNLTCPSSPTAILSSAAGGVGNIVVDNFLLVTSTAGESTLGPTNVCPGGGIQSCFTPAYQVPAGQGLLTGLDPDTFAATDGVAPIDISSFLTAGPVQLQVTLQDVGHGNGFYLASSSLYLYTNCTQGGVTGPALVSGNPISQNGPTPSQLVQDFSFNPTVNQSIGFTYDLSEAQADGSLTITDGTIPEVSDNPLDPAIYQSQYSPGTSFATSICLIHSGELLPSGQPACKLYTLECKIGDGSTASGAQCPVSSLSNELFQDSFDGPNFTLQDIPTPNGPTFHEGIGFLMASEGWTGGGCTFDPASGLEDLPCPQNLLSSFTSGTDASPEARHLKGREPLASSSKASSLGALAGRPRTEGTTSTGSTSYTSSGRTTHPNSTFLTIAQVPEDLTTVTVAGQQPGNWINNSTAQITFSSQPPNLAGTNLPGAATFVPSPIASITYGVTPSASVPSPGTTIASDSTLTNSAGCPTPANPTSPAAAVFTPDAVTSTGLADGQYLIHYYAQDCAGTEELKFTQDSNGNWSTSFYTYPLNVDTTAPTASTPTLSPLPSNSGAYNIGQTVTASFSCTDALSGVVSCGGQSFAAGTLNTGTLTAAVDTSSPGSKTFSITAIDAAGNQSTASVNYQVVNPYDPQIQFSLTPQTVTYPQGANMVITILPLPSSAPALKVGSTHLAKNRNGQDHPDLLVPTGTVQILDGLNILSTLHLQGNGSAYEYLHGLSAGPHSISVAYSGDAHNPGGVSAPVTFTVSPAPVRLDLDCWNSTMPYGGNYYCGVYASSDAGPAQGTVTYQFDGGTPTTVHLGFGVGFFAIPQPAVGHHSVSVSYAAQTNWAAAGPVTSNFTVTPAPVNVQLSPSTWNFTGGANLTLTASVQSWSAGPPQNTGSVTFADGGKTLTVVPVDGNGRASLAIPSAQLTNGKHNYTATYAGGANYGTGSATVTVVIAKH
jgi:hypothetical protein